MVGFQNRSAGFIKHRRSYGFDYLVRNGGNIQTTPQPTCLKAKVRIRALQEAQ